MKLGAAVAAEDRAQEEVFMLALVAVEEHTAVAASVL